RKCGGQYTGHIERPVRMEHIRGAQILDCSTDPWPGQDGIRNPQTLTGMNRRESMHGDSVFLVHATASIPRRRDDGDTIPGSKTAGDTVHHDLETAQMRWIVGTKDADVHSVPHAR